MGTRGVKSAQRVIEVLEYITSEAREATVMEIAKALGYPQSSTSMLLASLEKLGYLQTSADKKTYSATLRVMLLGARLQSDLFGEHDILGSMEALRARTGKTVMLGLRQHIHVRILVSLRSPTSSLRFPVGSLRPVCQSAIGKVLLAGLHHDEAAAIVRYANAKATEEHKVDIPDLFAELDDVRSRGWAMARGYPAPDRVAIAVPAPALVNQPALALNLGVTMQDLDHPGRLDAYVDELKRTSSKFTRAAP